MQQLAFRIYNPKTKKFIYSGSTPSMLADYFKQTATLVTINGIEHQQSTNLKDKNGKEIYEGDIVKHDFGKGSYASGIVKTPVIFEGGGFVTESCLLNLNDFDIEVIGNIYENPDLLK